MEAYCDWERANLTHRSLKLHRGHIGVWATEFTSRKPTAVLVHGVNGDHHGLVPLARELVADYNLILLDLPGHGKSSRQKIAATSDLVEWFDEACRLIETEIAPVTTVIGHSFGCVPVAGSRVVRDRIILITPVIALGRWYAWYARTMRLLSFLVAPIYCLKPFARLRGRVMAHEPADQEVRTRIDYVSSYSRATTMQTKYQASLTKILVDTSVYEDVADRDVSLVVMGQFDRLNRLSDESSLRRLFGSGAELAYVPSGHLAPIERPGVVAALLRGSN